MRNHLTSLFLSFIVGSSDPVRTALEASSTKWFRGVWISGAIVAIGCGLEIWEVVFDLSNWWRHRKKREPLPDHPGSWKYPLAAIGLFLVVAGIVGETVFEVLDANVESQIREHASGVIDDAESKAAEATKESGDAKASAIGAAEAATRAKKDADALEIRVQELNRQIDADSPRQEVLIAFEKGMIQRLKPFAGQKVLVELCGPLQPGIAGRDAREQNNFWIALQGRLLADAKWELALGPINWQHCIIPEGVGVFFVQNGPAENAAQALCGTLNAAFPQARPICSATVPYKGMEGERDSPYMLTAKDPGLIVVAVGI